MSPSTPRRSTAALLLALTLPACADTPALEAVSSRELGVVPQPEGVRGRDGGYSIGWRGRSVWVFGDTPLDVTAEDGARWRTSTFTTTFDEDLADGVGATVEPLDGAGAPGQLVPFTGEEAAYNAANSEPACGEDCEAKWVLWPGPLVVDPATDEAIVSYIKIKDWVGGQSFARWSGPEGAVTRVEVDAGAEDPTMLFPLGDVELNTSNLLDEDFLVAYGCDGDDWGRCIVGRAPVDELWDRSVWRFWDGERWGSDWRDAEGIFDGAPIMDVHWMPQHELFVAVYSDLESDVMLRTAPRPQGPWSGPTVIHHAKAPEGDGWIYDALAHHEFDSADGSTIYVSYSRSTGFLQSEHRWVEVKLARR